MSGDTIIIRTNRIEQVRNFIESGEPEREVAVNEGETIGTVRSTLQNTIVSRPYFKARCYVEQRNWRLYLVRR